MNTAASKLVSVKEPAVLKLSEIIKHATILHNAKQSLKTLRDTKSPKGKKARKMDVVVDEKILAKVRSSKSGIIESMEQTIKHHEDWFRSNEIDPDKTNILKLYKHANSED